MSTIDTGLTLIRNAAGSVSAANGWMGRRFNNFMPKGLYARALLIMIVPMVILQSVVAFVFMERHWNTVTQRLSAAVVQDIAALIDVYKGYPQDKDRAQLRRIAQQRLGLNVRAESGGKILGNALVDQHALHGNARLSGIGEAAEVRHVRPRLFARRRLEDDAGHGDQE